MNVGQPILLHHSIDHLVVKGQTMFCWGWIFDENDALKDLRVRLSLIDGRVIEQPAQHGALREDVRNAYPRHRTAAASGFMVSAAWSGAALAQAELIVTVASGVSKHVPLSLYQQEKQDQNGFVSRLKRVSHMGMALTLRAIRLIRHGHFRVLWEKAQRYLAARPTRVRDPAQELKRVLQDATNGNRAVLVVDHDLGGGAPQYRNQLIEQRVAAGQPVLLLTFHVPTLTYAAQVYGRRATERIALHDLEIFMDLARDGLIGDIFFNNSVSFPEPEKIPDFIVGLHKITGGDLTLAVHDFNMLCPSHFLLDASGRFCNVPETAVCESCLSRNQEGFVNFFLQRNIIVWRKQWRKLIDAADNLVFFSKSTQQLFLKAYPDVEIEKLHIQPHKMGYFCAQKIKVDLSAPLHIGVVGNIGRHKGSKILAQLAYTIREHGSKVKITIFGLIDEPVPKEIVRITGHYSHADLPKLIEKSGVNLMLVPSIVPETFSYVTHELMMMDLPIVCFDLGAQAEALRDYAHGRVIPLMGADALLDALQLAHHDS